MKFQINIKTQKDEIEITHVSFDDDSVMKKPSLAKMVLGVVYATIIGGVAAASIYGAVNKDYGPLENIVDASVHVFTAFSKALNGVKNE